MKRRALLAGMSCFSALALAKAKPSIGILPDAIHHYTAFDPPPIDPDIDREYVSVPVLETSESSPVMNKGELKGENDLDGENDQESGLARQVRQKSIDFARDYADDIYVSESDQYLLQSLFLRLGKIQKTIGFGHFNRVSLDQAIRYARNYSSIGQFTQAELTYMEQLFTTDAKYYGFFGKRVTETLSHSVSSNQIKKIPYSGHYLFNNESLVLYEKLKRDVGDSLILTSGIRSNIKQLHLFLAKTIQVKGNLSRASRSLAPPGYSYHGIGDFDVGKVGWGKRNFSDDFASTEEYKKMQDLDYINTRYRVGNDLGVRFEPWHIMV